MSRFGKFLIGVLAVTLLAVVTHFIHRNRIAADLTASSQAQLDSGFMSWAKISFVDEGLRYRRGIITGSPPSPESEAEARALVLNALDNNRFRIWTMRAGGVEDVVIRKTATAQPVTDPYIWRAVVVGPDVTLNGDVPDEATRAALLADAKTLFGPKGLTVIDQMQVRTSPPAGDWLGTAKLGLATLARLGNEFAELNDVNLTVVGTAPDDAARTAAETALTGSIPAGFTPSPAISTAGATPAAVQTEIDTCQRDIDAIMADTTIRFDSGKATLRETPNYTLDKLAEVARSCPHTHIAIGGHTDTRGNDAANLALSQARADTVKTYLQGKAIDAARLEATGYGETRPVDPDDSAEAHEKNRRIEFTVSQAAD